MARVKHIKVKDAPNLSKFPSFSSNGSVKGMKRLFYGKEALLVKCGNYIYNVTSQPEIYNNLAK